MITVTIAINGTVVLARSAVNKGELPGHRAMCRYEVDDGSEVLHRPIDGAVPLAIALLKTIKEPGKS